MSESMAFEKIKENKGPLKYTARGFLFNELYF